MSTVHIEVTTATGHPKPAREIAQAIYEVLEDFVLRELIDQSRAIANEALEYAAHTIHINIGGTEMELDISFDDEDEVETEST